MKLFLVTLVSIVAVSLLTLYITIGMSEKLFLRTFTITNSKLLSQMKSNLESYNNAVATSATMMNQNGAIRTYLSGGETDAASLAIETYNMAEGMKAIRSNLGAYEVGITIVGVNRRSYSADPWYWSVSTEELKDHPITRESLDYPAQILYRLYEEPDEDGHKGEPMLVAVKALYDRASRNVYGMMYVAIRDRHFKPFYANFTSEGNDVVLMNRQGRIISGNRAELIGLEVPELLNEVKSEPSRGFQAEGAEILGGERVVFSEYLPEFDVYLVNLIDKQAVTSQMVNVKAITLTTMAIVLGSLVIVFWITRNMTKSLRMLVGQMANIPTSGFEHHVDVSAGSSYEVKELGTAFNYMLDELNDYVSQLMETQKQQRNAELAALQMQINPHFLYNTLASVKFLVQQGSKEKAADTIHALISLLQNTVSDVESTIPVRQELAILDDYVRINHARYGERIRVNVFAEPESLDYGVPKLIMQPFIENAFFHAFNEKGEGSILVMVSVQDEGLLCEVVDNGDGMDLAHRENAGVPLPEQKHRRQLFSGIGIRNVHDRIKLMYGEGYGVDISSSRGEGTKIQIRLPLIKPKDIAKT